MKGQLHLGFERDAGAGRTVLRVQRQDPPWQVVRAFPVAGGAALVHLHNLSGGVLGGDELALTVTVGPGAAAQLTTTGATRLYRSRAAGLSAAQRTTLVVGPWGLLEYLPDPLIPFAGSCYRQETMVELAAGAGLFWWETVAPGRAARGEMFAYEHFEARVEIRAGDRPLVLERTRLVPAERAPGSPARLGPYGYFAGFYICRAGPAPVDWRALEGELAELAGQASLPGEVLWGVSTLPAHGLVVRALSHTGRAIAAGLPAFWGAAKRRLYGCDAVPPRKVY